MLLELAECFEQKITKTSFFSCFQRNLEMGDRGEQEVLFSIDFSIVSCSPQPSSYTRLPIGKKGKGQREANKTIKGWEGGERVIDKYVKTCCKTCPAHYKHI